ncbi:MAG TPA: DUF4097 family beta strand repeat-containing protein [Candidatus Dormibacteraeota bacterium]|nr:DUF4097 family beta strand repeat-containing protein [Candidatus Dormibacteraeota bacterium]
MSTGKRIGQSLVAIGFAIAVVPAFAQRLQKRFPVMSHPVVTLHNSRGKIVIRTWQKSEVQVIADQKSPKMDVSAQRQGNMIVVSTRFLAGSITPAEMETDFDITVPEETELSIHDDSGQIDVQGVLGDMTYETVGADVNLNQVTGYITVHTIGGSFTCNQCSGGIEANSISGAINVVGSESSNVHARTSTGNILLDSDLLPNGLYQLRDYSGEVDVFFSPSDSFDVTAVSLHGRVVNQAALKEPARPQYDLPPFARSLFGVYNEGRARLVINSFSGTIQIRRRQ